MCFSGLLLAYTCFRKMEKIRGTFNWISFWVLFYFHRFWRYYSLKISIELMLLNVHFLNSLNEHIFSSFIKSVCLSVCLSLNLFLSLAFDRLTPSYMFVILFWVHIKEFLSSTPYWLTVTADAPLCSKYWWTNLLYISNFYPKEFKDQVMF